MAQNQIIYNDVLMPKATKIDTKIIEVFHIVADDGATGIFVLFDGALLQPFPSQIEQ